MTRKIPLHNSTDVFWLIQFWDVLSSGYFQKPQNNVFLSFHLFQSCLKRPQLTQGSKLAVLEVLLTSVAKKINSLSSIFVSICIIEMRQSLLVFAASILYRKHCSVGLQIPPLFHRRWQFFIFAHITHWTAFVFFWGGQRSNKCSKY